MHFDCFALRTAEGAVLARPVLCIPRSYRYVGWLMAPDGGDVRVPGDDAVGPALPVRLEHTGFSGPVRLEHALRRRFVLAHGTDAEGGPRTLRFAHAGRDSRQDFALEPVACGQIVAEMAGELAGALGASPCFGGVLAALRRGRLRAGLAEAALRCLPLDELESLARHLLVQAEDLALLQTAMPGNVWLGRRLPMLIAWCAARAEGRVQATLPSPEPSTDLAGADGRPLPSFTLGLALSAYARAATPPRRMACVLATARNEGAYLLEWIAYHRSVGFEHIFLYTNDNTDGSDEMLRLLADSGVISWFDNHVRPTTLPQHRAYAHGLSVMPAILDYRWTMIADIDEFVGFDTQSFSAITDYLAWQEQHRAEAVALPWKLHVARPGDYWDEAPSIERFVLRDAAINAYVKMIFRTNLVWGANPHHPEPRLGAGLVFRGEDGGAFQQRSTPAQVLKPTALRAWMSHYAFRSAPEMIMKLGRGRADQPAAAQGDSVARRIGTFMAQIHTTSLVEDRSTALCGAGLAAERARLLEIPGLAACEAEIKRLYAARMRQACAAFLEESAETRSDQVRALCALLRTPGPAREARILSFG